MADSFNWTCPTCGTHTTITGSSICSRVIDFYTGNTARANGIVVRGVLIDCPNLKCLAQSFRVHVNRGTRDNAGGLTAIPTAPVGIGSFTFLPTTATPLSRHPPASAIEDYNEAYLISKLSPKASATLARRALQGMVRDFFQLPKLRTLNDELVFIKDKCDPGLHSAMMAIRTIGNIGAHPERDVSLIVEVEPGEPEALLELIHLLDNEWYVARAQRASRIEKVQALGKNKADVSVKRGLGLADFTPPNQTSN